MIPPKIHLLCAADRSFLRHVPVMLSSVRKNTTAPVKASILSTEWKQSDQEKLRRATPGIELNFLTLSEKAFEGLSFKAMLSPLTYARIMMPELVDDDRFIYLDVDMIVRKDIAELWRVDLNGAPAAGVIHNEAQGLNAGLLLIDAKLWRDRNLSKQMLDFARTYQPKNADQDAIEGIIGPEIKRLDSRWNTLVDPVWGKQLLGIDGYFENAAVLHYISGFKPWNFGRFLLPRRYAQEWTKYKKRTGLPVDWKAECKTFAWQIYVLTRRFLGK